MDTATLLVTAGNAWMFTVGALTYVYILEFFWAWLGVTSKRAHSAMACAQNRELPRRGDIVGFSSRNGYLKKRGTKRLQTSAQQE